MSESSVYFSMYELSYSQLLNLLWIVMIEFDKLFILNLIHINEFHEPISCASNLCLDKLCFDLAR